LRCEKHGAEVERPNREGNKYTGVPEFSDAAIGPCGGLVDIGGIFHLKSFMGALVVKRLNKSVELALLLKEIRTGWPRGLHL
jgi:hypothetical protein